MKQRGKLPYGSGGNLADGRAALIAAARAAFGELGPGSGIDDVARHAGIDAAVFGEYFRYREELVDAVLDDLVMSINDDDRPATGWTPQLPTLQPRYAVAPLAALAALVPIGPAPAAAAMTVDPAATVLEVTPLWPVWSLDHALQGSLCETGGCDVMPYLPFSTPVGLNLLSDRLAPTSADRATAGAGTVVFGFSHGAVVASRWLAAHADDPRAPGTDQLSFVLIGNPTRAHGGTMAPMPQTPYQVIDIVRQYDPVADYPDNPFNLLAMLNISAGILSSIHLDYTGVDVDDPANTVWTEGNTTYVFVPTENLPLLTPLRLLGMGWLADALNEPLKEIVERAYDRPYLNPSPPVIPQADAAAAASDPAEDIGYSANAQIAPQPSSSGAGRHRATVTDAATATTASVADHEEPVDDIDDVDEKSADVSADLADDQNDTAGTEVASDDDETADSDTSDEDAPQGDKAPAGRDAETAD